MRLLNRLLQRLVVLGLGIFSVWLIVFVVFDTADQRLPWILAVSLTYGIAAYVILPRILARLTSTGPWPWRTRRSRPSGSFSSRMLAR
jgi:hypothetical protein